MVTVAQINELRKATQVSMLLCKQALEATGGDFDADVTAEHEVVVDLYVAAPST